MYWIFKSANGSSNNAHVVSFAGIVAAIVFMTLCVLAVLIRFLYQHREPRPPPVIAVKSKRPSLDVEPSKPSHVGKEYFIWQKFCFCCISCRNNIIQQLCTRVPDSSLPTLLCHLLIQASSPVWCSCWVLIQAGQEVRVCMQFTLMWKKRLFWKQKKIYDEEIIRTCMTYCVLFDNKETQSNPAPYTRPSQVKTRDKKQDGLLNPTLLDSAQALCFVTYSNLVHSDITEEDTSFSVLFTVWKKSPVSCHVKTYL